MKRHQLRTASDHLSSCFIYIYFMGAFTQTPAVWLSLSLSRHFGPCLIVMNNFVYIKLVFCVCLMSIPQLEPPRLHKDVVSQREGTSANTMKNHVNELQILTRVSMNVAPGLEATVNILPENMVLMLLFPVTLDCCVFQITGMTQDEQYGYMSFLLIFFLCLHMWVVLKVSNA